MSAGAVVWLTGVPASGKTTLARALVAALRADGRAVLWLDSDALRAVMTPSPTYSDAERQAFYDTIGYLARLGAEGGVVVVISATAMRRVYRDSVRAAVPTFLEIWLTCPAEVLRRRDPKGLYKKVDTGEVKKLPTEGDTSTPGQGLVAGKPVIRLGNV